MRAKLWLSVGTGWYGWREGFHHVMLNRTLKWALPVEQRSQVFFTI